MSRKFGRGSLTVILSFVTIGAALSFGVATATAGDNNVTEDQIVRALVPVKKPLTRGCRSVRRSEPDPAAVAAEGRFVQTIRGRTTRSLSNTEREEIATIVKDKPKIDLEINFDYNSADISARSLSSVQALGKALTNPDLKGSTFVVAGHTDAAGGESYNQDLSERRADAIKRYLIDKLRHCRQRPRDRRIRQEQAQGPGQPDGGCQPPRAGRQYGKQGPRRPSKRLATLSRVLQQECVPHVSGTRSFQISEW